MIDYCILMGWEANIEASKEKYIFFFQNSNCWNTLRCGCFKLCHGENYI